MTKKKRLTLAESREAGYLEGCRAMGSRLLSEAARALGYSTDEGKLAAALAEREEAIAHLRELCDAYGDTDWEPTLHLADIIEKHLGRHLDEELGRR